MNRVVAVSLTVNVYALMLKLYPVRFRRIFGEEMAGVFAAALCDSRQRGRSAAVTLFAREMLLLPISAAQQHLGHLNLCAPGEGPEIRPLAWIKVLLAIFPGLLTLLPIFNIFGYSRDTPFVLGLTCLLPLAMSLLVERRVALWSLPGLGLLISWGLWFGAGWVLPAATVIVVMALIWQTLRSRAEVWLPWAVLGLMLTLMLVMYAFVILITGTLQGVMQGQIFAARPGVELHQAYLPLGLALFVVAAGLPFARRFGAAAVIVTLSAMMWPMFRMLIIGGESMGQGLTPQIILAETYIAILLIALPLWALRASSRAGRMQGVLIPLLAALIGGAGVTIWFYTRGDAEAAALIANRAQYVIQSLLALALALVLYDRIGGRAPAAEPATETTSASRV